MNGKKSKGGKSPGEMEESSAAMEMEELEGESNHKDENSKDKKKSKPEEKAKAKTIEYGEEKYFGNVRLVKEDTPGDDPDVVVSMNNVHKTYLLGIEGVPALRGVTMSIKRGEFVCIFGTSGGGKTTMLNIMGTIDKPTKGELRIGGTRITSRTKDTELSLIRLQKNWFCVSNIQLIGFFICIRKCRNANDIEWCFITSRTKTKSQRIVGYCWNVQKIGSYSKSIEWWRTTKSDHCQSYC